MLFLFINNNNKTKQLSEDWWVQPASHLTPEVTVGGYQLRDWEKKFVIVIIIIIINYYYYYYYYMFYFYLFYKYKGGKREFGNDN